jgi:hypothetical protein
MEIYYRIFMIDFLNFMNRYTGWIDYNVINYHIKKLDILLGYKYGVQIDQGISTEQSDTCSVASNSVSDGSSHEEFQIYDSSDAREGDDENESQETSIEKSDGSKDNPNGGDGIPNDSHGDSSNVQ